MVSHLGNTFGVTVTLLLCITLCASRLSISKCCAEGERLHTNIGNPKCVNSDHNETSWVPEEFSLQAFLHNATSHLIPCGTEDVEVLLHSDFLSKDEFRIFDNGTLADKHNNTFPATSYCVDRVNHASNSYAALLCPCLTMGCIRVCCGDDNKVFNSTARKCVKAERTVARNLTIFAKDFETLSARRVFFLHQMPKCSSTGFHLLNWSEDNAISDNGDLKAKGYTDTIPSTDYCSALTVVPNEIILLNCFPEQQNVLHSQLYSPLMIIGSIFLLATFVVYALLPEMRNLHGKNLMSHTASLFVAYVAIATNQLAEPQMPDELCILSGFVIQFSFLASFFWLNVMCIDISWTFSGLRSRSRIATGRSDKKFIYYSIYAWGCTAVVSVVTAVVDFAPGIPNTVLKPHIGNGQCWFKDKMATLAFFYGPIAALLLMNIILFAYTSTKIVRARRGGSVLKKGQSNTSRGERERLIVYMKLFVLMGLSWITEIISWAVGGHDYYWYATDIVNLLLAVFIFIIFVCKRKVLRLLQDRYQCLRFGVSTQSRESTSTNSTTAPPLAMSSTITRTESINNDNESRW